MTDRLRLRDYFVEHDAPMAEDAEPALWNPSSSSRHDEHTAEMDVVLEQYKLYVEMADRVSARRALANSFFLTLNTAIFTVVGVAWNRQPSAPQIVALVPLVILLAQCLVWFWVVRSYRQLNAGKWAVVGALERRLPASPWWAAEWRVLGEGGSPARYWPLTHVEQWVPALFAVAYVVGFLGLLLL